MVNKVTLLGNVGQDPDVRYLENGTPYARFSLATNENYKNKAGEKVTHTEWHNIVVWRRQAEVVEQYVKKGMLLYIEGRIRKSQVEKDGVTKYYTDILCDNFQMLGKRGETMPPPKDPLEEGTTQNSSNNAQKTQQEQKPNEYQNAPLGDDQPDLSQENDNGGDDLPF